ncbi:hypothetical protein E6W39_29245 [Kitasatospora acidiphila]|uniref:Minor tail protein n=1 Tax=Kitasatospora acidiphila TaxID=2567942 RepID=A0A540W983_9ACTN|nr:hypothetical protein [Kitasatospora acidiphila]TQF05571.1 hypothetical protein E6W39_29245 [Kitasatospora acidiphila]
MTDAITQLAQRIAALETALPELSRSSNLAHSSIDDGALTVISDGTVRAIIGQQSDGTTAFNVVNGPVPPTPSAPTATSILGGVRVTWDGRFTAGQVCPLDFARIEVHAAPAADFVPSSQSLISTIESPRGGSATIPTTVPVQVVLVARTTSGKASATSGTATAGPAKVVADEVLPGIIGELQLADDAVTAAKVATGAIDATAIADLAVTATKLGQAAVIAGKIAADAVTPGTIAAGAITAREITAGAVTATKLAAGAVTAAALSADAVNGRTITGATIQGGTVTGSQVRTAATGRRIEITPSDPIRASPGVTFYSGSDTELQPGLLSATSTTGTITTPALTLQAPSIDKSSSWLYPSDAASLRLTSRSGNNRSDGTFSLSAAAGINELGICTVRGVAPGDQSQPAMLTFEVRNPVPTGTSDYRNTIIDITGRQMKIAFNAVGIVLDEHGLRYDDTGWQPLAFANGWTSLPGWRAVEYRRTPDGMAHLRGIGKTPASFTSGRIGTITDPNCRPKAPEVIPVANDNSSKCCIFIYPEGGVDLSSNAGWPGSWVSFGYSRWSVTG